MALIEIRNLSKAFGTVNVASMDLGANQLTTFRLVTFPLIRSALVAGQTTLPIWIFQNLFRPNQAPIVNVVAAALILISILPIYLSQRLTFEK